MRVEGFEPPTAWFVARYSIQLSYTRHDILSIKSLKLPFFAQSENGAGGGIRTPDRLVRSQVLYPAELHPRFKDLYKNGGGGEIRTLEQAINPLLP